MTVNIDSDHTHLECTMYQSQYFVNSSIPKAYHHLASKHDFHQFPPRFQGSHATTNASGANHLSGSPTIWTKNWKSLFDTCHKWTTPIAVRHLCARCKKPTQKLFFMSDIFQSNINHGQSWPTCEDLQLLDTFLWISVSFWICNPSKKTKNTGQTPLISRRWLWLRSIPTENPNIDLFHDLVIFGVAWIDV